MESLIFNRIEKLVWGIFILNILIYHKINFLCDIFVVVLLYQRFDIILMLR